MDGFVRKLAANSTEEPLINLILKGRVKSKLVCIFDNSLHNCQPLLQYIKKEHTIDSFKTLNEAANSNNNLIHLTDFSLDLLASKNRPQLFASLVAFVNGRSGRTIIMDIQSDILEDSVINSLRYLVDTCFNTEGNGIYSVRHRIAGGSREQTELNQLTNGIISKTTNQSSTAPTIASNPSTTPLPTSTFNLEISREQREAKAQVLLPHIRVQMDDLPAPRVLAEDYDEEDPDDDLEI